MTHTLAIIAAVLAACFVALLALDFVHVLAAASLGSEAESEGWDGDVHTGGDNL